MTYSRDKYTVHELLDRVETSRILPLDPDLHASEIPGRDIVCDVDGLWRDITETSDNIRIDVGPLVHRGISSIFSQRFSILNPIKHLPWAMSSVKLSLHFARLSSWVRHFNFD
jgi:hypothetical protein